MQPAVLEAVATAPVEVRVFEEGDAGAWDAFVASAADATFFHRSGWRTVVREAFGHRDLYLLAERNGEVCGILPLFHMRSLLFGNSLTSIPFCVYGGIVARDTAAAQALGERALALTRELGADCLELRHRQRQFPDWPAKDLYVTFRKEISADDDENMQAIPRKQRAMIRKAIKAGLSAGVDTEIDVFYSMYSESVRNLGTPVFAKRYFKLLQRTFGDAVEILVVSDGATPVSAVMSFYHRDEVLPYYGGGTQRARAVKANDFMYWELMCRAARRGVRIFDYGRSKKDTGSYRFKKHWGFEPQDLHYEFGLNGIDRVPDVSPANPKYRLFIAAWKRLPVPVARLIGPHIARHLG